MSSTLKGNTIYMVLYNYSDCDYSIVKIVQNKEDAYNFICHQEANHYNNSDTFRMIHIKNSEQLEELERKVDEDDIDHLNICFIPSANYHKFDLCKYMTISSYVIVPMKIE